VWETIGLTFAEKAFKWTKQKDKRESSLFLHFHTIILPRLKISLEIKKPSYLLKDKIQQV
jgi:hypothetical protein